MGGGRRFHFPKWVWTPYGGWWADPPKWKRDTAIALVAINTTMYFVFQWSEKNMISYDNSPPVPDHIRAKYENTDGGHGHGGHH